MENFNTNLPRVAFSYINLLEISITKKTLQKALEQNPYYPSLYCLSNVFSRFNVSNMAFHLEEQNLSEMRAPFISYLKNQRTGKDFVLITSLNNNEVRYISDTSRENRMSKKNFLKDWENVIFIAQKNEKSGDSNYAENFKKEKKQKIKSFIALIAGLASSILLMALFISNLKSHEIMIASLILFTKSIGLVATGLLLSFESNKNNSFVASFCLAGKQTNCNAVLNSKKAKIWGLRWSELGFFYFTSTLIFLLFPGINFSDKISWVNFTNLICTPYILFSLYYQWRIVKQWCLFCLIVQCILVLQLCSSFYLFSKDFPQSIINLSSVYSMTLSILLPITGWIVLKPILDRARSKSIYHAAYKRLLNDPERFNSFLVKQSVAPEHENVGIIVGNQEAKNTIIAVCNPYCEPCARAHLILNKLVESNNDVNLKIIFNASDDENDKRKSPVAHLLAIYSKGNIKITLQSLNEWYSGKKSYAEFAANYPVNDYPKKQDEKINAMYTWCKKADIIYTPTIFVNGHKLPENYSLEELKEIL